MLINSYCHICKLSRVFEGSRQTGIYKCQSCHISKNAVVGAGWYEN